MAKKTFSKLMGVQLDRKDENGCVVGNYYQLKHIKNKKYGRYISFNSFKYEGCF